MIRIFIRNLTFVQATRIPKRPVFLCDSSVFVSGRKPGSGDLRHNVWLSVVTMRKRVGFGRKILDEPFLLRVERYPGSKSGGGATEINAVFAQILATTIEGIRQFTVFTDRCLDRLGR